MEKISEELATQEFERWFESKKLSSIYRKDEFESVEKQMIQAICDGYLVVNEDCTLTLMLAWPLSKPNEVTELKFVNRISTGELQVKTAYAKNDQLKKLTATIAVLTGQVGGTIMALDSVDFGRASCIAAYFF
ncbi:MAG: hypothetical protein PHW73_01000 [Atribacterota bacterium]|nr:hypothetical protein [Atribacterota bacterium]